MPGKQQLSLSITPKPSVRLKYLLDTAYLLSMISSLVNPLPVFYKTVFILVLAISYMLAIGGLEKKRYTLQYDEISGWKISNGLHFVPVIILPSTVITIYAIFLHLEILANCTNIAMAGIGGVLHTKRKNLLIMADSLNAEDYRNLTVKLKTTWNSKTKSAKT